MSYNELIVFQLSNLLCSGTKVLFSVDATKLDQCPSIEGAIFDAVVFNFPHVGGKGNIGKNRELLKHFFMW